MELKEIVDIVDHYFRPIIIVISTLIAIFLASKKIGNKISAHYMIVSDRFSAQRIDDILIVNYKDKPVPIFGIYALFNNKDILELELCDPPVVIEPYGSVSIKTKPFSKLTTEVGEYKPDYFKATILLNSVDKLITCKSYEKNLTMRNGYKSVSKSTKSFNGVVHTGSHPYVLSYMLNGEHKKSFISSTGIIENQWGQYYNAIKIGSGDTLNENIINKFLIQEGYAELFSNYVIFKLVNGNYLAVLGKNQ
ncbi:hypothetical protein [Acinetobacter sp. Ac_5812]|uniref:hypothetical protein n=1 Tax=Acinetobacter sp. Ac_5812 TaxID=1848937 RepID=UPI0014901997|nr:hypothetical protein [Acinetobacter sp. Ac_5812]NNP71227.1 hypothetical protein [Acinetobacter sp. Ac_5812]